MGILPNLLVSGQLLGLQGLRQMWCLDSYIQRLCTIDGDGLGKDGGCPEGLNWIQQISMFRRGAHFEGMLEGGS